MLMEDAIYYIYQYGFWALLAVAAIKFFFLLYYRSSVSYALRRFFYIYTDSRIVKEDVQRYQFRVWHNLLTWMLYVLAFIYLMVIFIKS